jgi:8-oxo-dGTP pyrophosphatase MutT (NUDIX family)
MIYRQAVRAILITPGNEVLLIRIRLRKETKTFWITPGGGLEPGETIVQGLGRELREELGLERFTVGPLVWRRQHTFSWYPNEVDPVQRICQTEQYHVIHVSRFEPKMTDATELKVLQEFRWWPSASLAHAEEPLTPTSLAQIVARYISCGPPVEPLETEVLVD